MTTPTADMMPMALELNDSDSERNRLGSVALLEGDGVPVVLALMDADQEMEEEPDAVMVYDDDADSLSVADTVALAE